MAELQMGMVESKFADIIWQHAPVTSSQLVKLGEMELGWKRTTTYTVIKRLCDKGCLKNEATIVSSLVPRETVQQADGQEVLARSFGGSFFGGSLLGAPSELAPPKSLLRNGKVAVLPSSSSSSPGCARRSSAPCRVC